MGNASSRRSYPPGRGQRRCAAGAYWRGQTLLKDRRHGERGENMYIFKDFHITFVKKKKMPLLFACYCKLEEGFFVVIKGTKATS